MLVPYLNLSPEERIQIVKMELAEGKQAFSKMLTKVDGRATTVLACKQWGVIVLGGQLLGLARYPLNALDSISIDTKNSTLSQK
jgi:hypothetical protein